MFFYLKLTSTLWDGHYFSHLKGKETEAEGFGGLVWGRPARKWQNQDSHLVHWASPMFSPILWSPLSHWRCPAHPGSWGYWEECDPAPNVHQFRPSLDVTGLTWGTLDPRVRWGSCHWSRNQTPSSGWANPGFCTVGILHMQQKNHAGDSTLHLVTIEKLTKEGQHMPWEKMRFGVLSDSVPG